MMGEQGGLWEGGQVIEDRAAPCLSRRLQNGMFEKLTLKTTSSSSRHIFQSEVTLSVS